jgi:tripartite-type tricarboxylate transporter receptor subunit TctC
MEALSRSAPDGYTLALATMSQAVFNPFLFSALPYDPQRDLEPVATLVTGAMVIAANPSFAAASLADLAKLARTREARLFMAMPQNGSPPHVVALLVQKTVGLELAMVPYKAGAEAVAATIAGDVPLVIEAPTAIVPHVLAGRLKALVVTGSEREPLLPDTPTVAQSGYDGVPGEAWIGLVAPAGTPARIIARLNRELAAILASAQVRERMAALGFRTLVGSEAEFGQRMADDRARWSVIIRDAKLKLD